MDKPKLERCPHCDGVAHYSVTIFGSHIVVCGRCHAQSVPCANDELAAKFWNKRPKNSRAPLPDNKALTEGDRIRAMSDEKLAAFLDALCTDGSCSVCDNPHWCRRNNAPEPICKNHIRDWLKQPAGEENR